MRTKGITQGITGITGDNKSMICITIWHALGFLIGVVLGVLFAQLIIKLIDWAIERHDKAV